MSYLELGYPDVVTADEAEHQARAALNRFLASVERRAVIIAETATRNRDDALDIVQDSMLAFAHRYAAKPEAQWAPLFHRVLQNRIRDWHRRLSVKNRLFGWLTRPQERETEEIDPVQLAADPNERPPDKLVAESVAGDAMIDAISELPMRQREAFLLRIWEGLNVADTAQAMGCSDGSVKTHLSRALTTLRARLEDHHG